jgi:hypothetical protein
MFLDGEAADANQSHGALTSEFYLAGFTFERAMARVLGLLKSGGWRKVGGGFNDVNEFVRSLQLDRFKAVADQRKEFAKQVKELQPEVSNRAIADAMGVHHDTVDRDARGGNSPAKTRKAKKNGMASGGNPPSAAPELAKADSSSVEPIILKETPSAADGRRDANRIHQRDNREERPEEKLQSMGEAAELTGTFSVVYVDPPWEDEFGPNSRQIELHYPVMSDAELLRPTEVPGRTMARWKLGAALAKAERSAGPGRGKKGAANAASFSAVCERHRIDTSDATDAPAHRLSAAGAGASRALPFQTAFGRFFSFGSEGEQSFRSSSSTPQAHRNSGGAGIWNSGAMGPIANGGTIEGSAGGSPSGAARDAIYSPGPTAARQIQPLSPLSWPLHFREGLRPADVTVCLRLRPKSPELR